MSGDTQGPELSENEQRALDAVLDEIIPPGGDRGMPGAGQVGVARYVDAALRPTPALHQMVREGLAALAELASSQHALPPLLVLHAYAGYYQQPRVLEALGVEPRPPHPAGYATVEGDLSLLEPVRQRGRTYREC
jgi:Gluconate 2-dehydrogenase subunit 3